VPYLSKLCVKSAREGLTVANNLTMLSPNFDGFETTEDEYWAFNNVTVDPNMAYAANE